LPNIASSKYDEDLPGLARWISVQRKVFKKGTMEEKRKDRLDLLGFQWTAKAASESQHDSAPMRSTTHVSVNG
jgi:hypothetical protein